VNGGSYRPWGSPESEQTHNENSTGQQALAQHRAQAQQDLNVASQRKAQADSQLLQAQTQRDNAVQTASPTLQASATTGFGRHKALWAAVDAGKIPVWAAYGLMAVALLLECAGLLLKLFLPTDEAGFNRRAEAGITNAMGKAELRYIQEFSRQTGPVLRGRASHIQQDAERLVDNVLAPGMSTRMGADQFARAARATRAAQQRSGQAATTVIDELGKVMPGPWGASRREKRDEKGGRGSV
jgi:hypothetical protein